MLQIELWCFCFVASHPGAHLTVNTHLHHSLAALHLIFKSSTDKYVWIYGFNIQHARVCVCMDAHCMWKHMTVRTHAHSGSHTPRRHAAHTVNQLIYQFSMFFKSCMNSASPRLSVSTIANPAQHIPVPYACTKTQIWTSDKLKRCLCFIGDIVCTRVSMQA